MGITTEEFFQNVYNVIFSPKSFFENEDMNISIRLGAGIIILMAAFNKIAYMIANNSIGGQVFAISLVLSVICALVMWLLIGLFFEYIAKIFGRNGQYSKLLYLTAFATIPAIFFAPLNLLKQFGEIGYILSVILGCFLYLWIIILYANAVKNSYKITLARAFMLIFLPIISSIPAIYQIMGFYHNMWYIFSV